MHGLSKTKMQRINALSLQLPHHVCMNMALIPQYFFQIDPATVKHLDSNLFLGDEITEVYKEIMKTVPTDHLDLENVRTCRDYALFLLFTLKFAARYVSKLP